MECKTARLLLPFADELSPDDAEPLLRHLGECPDCEAERRLDRHIGHAVNDVPVPSGLKARLGDALAAGRAALWRKAVRPWVRLAAAAAAVAASVLFVVCSWGAFSGRFWPVGADNVQWHANVTRPGNADDANDALARLGFARSAPEFADYRLLLEGPMRAELPGSSGRQVPLLIFASGTRQAWVYIIDTRRTTLNDLTEPGEGYTRRAALWPPYPEERAAQRYVYLILHTGDSWEWLREA